MSEEKLVTKIGFIGLGKLGMDCAEVFAEKYTTCGYDISAVESSTVVIKDSIADVLDNSDWVFIAVPTPHDKAYGGELPSSHLAPKDFNYSIVKDVLTEIGQCNTDANIVLISTVLPGTTRREFAPLLDNTLIYNPYLIAMGSTKWDMKNPEMLILGSKDGDDPRVAELCAIYGELLEQTETRAEIGTWEEAEGIKIFYNTFISAKIGLVNMIQDFAMKIGHMNADVVSSALANSTKRIMGPQYMVPGMGDAGACHPRDNIALSHLADQYDIGYDMFGTIMQAREVQAENLADFLCEIAAEHDLPIVIHGRAYKPDVSYEEGSYSLLVGHYIKKQGQELWYADPLTGHNIDPMKAVVLWAHNRSITYGYTGQLGADTGTYFEMLEGSVIVDPWRRINKENDLYTVIHYGDTRAG